MKQAFVIALLGAESTGKTTLSHQIAAALNEAGHDAVGVEEYLREFCEQQQRTPRIDEQRAIADEQTRRIEEAASTHAIVVADTTALMIAVYSDHVFGDTSLYTHASSAHARCNLTLLTALDLAWQDDGLQREGPHVREPIDTRIRNALHAAGIGYAVVSGSGERRIAAAMSAVRHALQTPAPDHETGGPRWQWVCERCGDANCERHLLPLLTAPNCDPG